MVFAFFVVHVHRQNADIADFRPLGRFVFKLHLELAVVHIHNFGFIVEPVVSLALHPLTDHYLQRLHIIWA